MSDMLMNKIVPDGWIDLQVNGFVGVDFSAPGLTVADIRRVTEVLVRRGTAAYCPTVVTSAMERYEENLPVLVAAMEEPDLNPHLLGIHLEGPFLSLEGRGAHQAALLRKPDVQLLDHWLTLAKGHISLLTLAPEVEGAEALIRHAVARGVMVLLGHHVADGASIDRAVRAGARGCTHLGNGIPNILPRHPNPIWSQLADDRLIAMLITDGHHLPVEFVRSVLRVKGLDRCIVTSDAAPIAGLPPGRYTWMGTELVSEPLGRIGLANTDVLAGSSATMADCVAWLRSWSQLDEQDLRKLCRENPLRLLGKY
ncbi:MAG: N-acetylglucosamine-6-phosphate deacetylase [bacterium]